MKLHKEHTPLPGTERYTQPSEIKALSKFLGHIKEVQEEHTEIEKDNLRLPGEKGASTSDTSLPRIPLPITSLPGHSIPVEGISPENNIKLEGGAEKLSINAPDPKLEGYREELKDRREIGLENGKVIIETPPEEPSLEDAVLGISTGDDVALEDGKEIIEDYRELGLENQREDITGGEKDLRLIDHKDEIPESINKEGEKISELPSSTVPQSITPKDIENLEGPGSVVEIKKPSDISLETGKEKIKAPKDIPLETTKEKLKKPKDKSLESGSLPLNAKEGPGNLENTVFKAPGKKVEPTLEEGKETLVGHKDVELSGESLSITPNETPDLDDSLETIIDTDIDINLEEHREEIESKSPISLEDHKENLSSSPQDINLEDHRETISPSRGMDSLETEKETLNTSGVVESLETHKEPLNSQNQDLSLETRVKTISGREEISLEERKETISSLQEIDSLEDHKENLSSSPQDINLGDHRETISPKETQDLRQDYKELSTGDEKVSQLPGDSLKISPQETSELPKDSLTLEGSLELDLEDISINLPSERKEPDLETKSLSLTGDLEDPGELENYIEELEDPREQELENTRLDISPEDKVIELPGESIFRPGENVEVSDLPGSEETISKLPDGQEGYLTDGPESLVDFREDIQKPEDIELDTTRLDITSPGDIDLVDYRENIEGSEDKELVDYREDIESPEDIDLSDIRLNIDSPEDLSLVDYREDINSPEDLDLLEGKILRPSEGDRTEISRESDNNGFNSWRDRQIGNLEPLDTPEDFENYLESIRDNDLKPGVEEYYERTEEYLSKDSRVRIDRPSNAEDGDRTTTSTAKGFNAWKSKHPDRDDSEIIINQGDFSEENGELRKKILRPSNAESGDRTTTFPESDAKGNELLETPEGFKEYISEERKKRSTPKTEYKDGKVITPNSAEDGDRTTTSTAKGFNAWFSKLSDEEKEEWNKNHIPPELEEGVLLRPSNAGNGDRTTTSGEEGFEFWKNRNVTNEEPIETPDDFKKYQEVNEKTLGVEDKYRWTLKKDENTDRTLTSADKGYKEITELDTGKKGIFGGNWGSKTDPGDIPHYKLPDIGWGNFWSGGALNPSTYLRWAAENTVGLLPLRGSAKQKIIDETLHFLVWGREALEKLAKANRDRLPGDDMGLVSDLVRGTNVKEMATKVVGAVGSALSNSAVDLKEPYNRPQKKQSSWKSPGQEVLDKVNPGESGKGSGGWRKLASGLVGDLAGYDKTPDSQKRSFKDYLIGGELGKDGLDRSFGIGTTLNDLISKDKSSCTDLETFREALRHSRFITTPDKFTSTANSRIYTTLDSNHVWEIIFRPYVGKPNGEKTWLPSFQEIDYQNKKAFNYTTYYSRGWLPITGFELQEKKLTSKDLPLYDGAISYPVSMEFTNELRISFADDSLKSLRRYFDLCTKVSAYMSNIHKPLETDVEIKTTNEETLNDGKGGKFISTNVKTKTVKSGGDGYIYDFPIDYISEIRNPTVYLEGKIHPGLYKNLSFLVTIYILTPQYGTIKKCNLLCVLKDYTIENQGEIDSSPTELNVTFSIVGENPPSDGYISKSKSYTPPPKTGLTDRTGTSLLDNLGGVMSVF